MYLGQHPLQGWGTAQALEGWSKELLRWYCSAVHSPLQKQKEPAVVKVNTKQLHSALPFEENMVSAWDEVRGVSPPKVTGAIQSGAPRSAV